MGNSHDSPIEHSQREKANLAVIKPIIEALNRRPIKDPSGVRKADCVRADVGKVLVRVPGEPHDA